MSAEKQLFMKSCPSITGQIWHLKGNLILKDLIAWNSFGT